MLWYLVLAVACSCSVHYVNSESTNDSSVSTNRSSLFLGGLANDTSYPCEVDSRPFIGEVPPENFVVDLTLKKGGFAFTRLDFYTLLLRNMAETAIRDWNAEWDELFVMRPVENMLTTFLPSKDPPRYHTKTVIWTLTWIFNQFNHFQTFGEAQWSTQLEPETIGVGKMTYRTMDSQSSSPFNETAEVISSSVNTSSSSEAEISSKTWVSTEDFGNSSSSNSSSPSNANGLEIRISYAIGGRIYNSENFYCTVVAAMRRAAEFEAYTIAPVFSAYNQAENYTLWIGPNEDKRDVFKWYIIITTLWLLPEAMIDAGKPAGRWAELEGKLKLNGEYIGALVILRGNRRPMPEPGLIDLGTGSTTLGPVRGTRRKQPRPIAGAGLWPTNLPAETE